MAATKRKRAPRSAAPAFDPKEDVIQKAVAQHLMMRAGPGCYWFHPANGEARNAITGAKLKAMGVRAGTGDFVLCIKGRFHMLELKRRKGRLSAAQVATRQMVELAGGASPELKEVDRRIDASPELKEVVDTIREFRVDNAEATADALVAAGNDKVAIFILKSQGKNRGYSEAKGQAPVESLTLRGSQGARAPASPDVRRHPQARRLGAAGGSCPDDRGEAGGTAGAG